MKTYIIDLDGTMYSGDKNIDGAIHFIEYLQDKKIPYIFLTNNATRTRKQAKEHMLKLGFKNIKEDDFFTSAIAAAKYAKQNYTERNCFVIGEDGLIEALYLEGFNLVQDNADFVFVGLDRKATYQKYSNAVHNVLKGAKFIATNNDRLLPNNGRFDAGNGAAVALIEYATNQKSIKVGKPFPIILEILMREYNLLKEDLILIGDNLETDIKLGYDCNIETIMVCTGVHGPDDIEKLKVYPTHCINNLKELIK